MIELEIKTYHSADVDITKYRPDSNAEVFFNLQMSIGVAGEDAADIYQTMIATPEGIMYARIARPELNLISDRAMIVVSKYSHDLLFDELSLILKKCEDINYAESSLKLQRYFMWEYEDFVIDNAED